MRARANRRTALGIAVLLLTFTSLSAAQDITGLGATGEQVPTPDQREPTSVAAIAARQAVVAQELAAVRETLATAEDEALRTHFVEVRDRLRDIDSLLRKEAGLTDAAASAEPEPPDEPPGTTASLFTLNDLYEAQHDAERRKSWLAEALAASRDALAAAKAKLGEAEKERRELRARLEAIDDPLVRGHAERALELGKLASRGAQERVYLRTLELQVAAREHDAGSEASDIEGRIAAIRAAIERGDDSSHAGFAALTEREGALRRKREGAERALTTVELRLDAAQQRFSRLADPAPEVLTELEALTATRDAIRQEIALLDSRLERFEGQRTIWRQWHTALRGDGAREELTSWKDAVEDRIDALERAEVHASGQQRDLERRLEAIDGRLEQLPSDAHIRGALEEQRKALAQVLDTARAETADLAADRRLSERVLAELRDRTGVINPLEYVANGLRAIRDVWTYEITTVDDAPITVGSLALAILLAGLGLWAARHGSALAGQVATERFKLDPGAAQALQSLSFYVLLVSFTLLALRAVHFPLTAFTVLGGALAIGIGFGSQNVMNNFISGLILMLERPVRAGDVVEVDSNHGTIERIGARSTQIRSVDGRHIVVPNSFFLENNVVNWTLSDDLIRTSVLVGVIYGSPTRLVEKLIRQVVDEEPEVLRKPEPIILFDEFGDNSLNFQVHFWVRARAPMAMRRVQSALRFRIDDLFREHGLVIAFPQRDVHLDSASPIEVRVVNGGNRDQQTDGE